MEQNLVAILREQLLRNSMYNASGVEAETPYEAIKRVEHDCDEIMERVDSPELKASIEDAYSLCMAAYEDHGFQCGIQAGAQLMLELLGKGPRMEA